MENFNQLIVSGHLKCATKLMNNVSSKELNEAVDYLQNLSSEEIDNKVSKIKQEISSKTAEINALKNEALEYAKEKAQDEIEEYSKKLPVINSRIKEIDDLIKAEVEEVAKHNSRECEKCGSKMKLRASYRGEFLGCSSFPKCKNTSNDVKKLKQETLDLKLEKMTLSSESTRTQRLIDNFKLENIKAPIYKKEVAQKVNNLTREISELKTSIQIFKDLEKGLKTPFLRQLEVVLQREKMEPYLNQFLRKPYLKDSIVLERFETLKQIETEIMSKLSNFPNLVAIDFCDVSAGGIQIRGFHKEINGYSYGAQPTIKYDFSNVDEVIEEFVRMWKDSDNEKYVESKKRFIADGEKYGWD